MVDDIFFLAQILYLPPDGLGEVLLGEELLDWVNRVDTGTSVFSGLTRPGAEC